MAYIDDLTTARDNFAAQLAEISASPKPTYSVDGQQVSWTEHYKFISEQIDKLNLQIAAASPFEIQTQLYT